MGKLGNEYVIPVVIIAALSVCASLSVFLTHILFREMRNKPFMKIVAYVSIADFFGNVGYLRPNKPPSGSADCIIEAFFNAALYPCSWMWTTILVYFLYRLATEGHTPENFTIYYIICWMLPIILFLIQTPFTEFKRPNDYEFEVCAVGGYSGLIYHMITYYGLYFATLLTMCYLQWRIYLLEKQGVENVKAPAFKIAKSALTLYPIWMSICWLPHVATVIVLNFFTWKGNAEDMVYYLGDILKIMHGGIAAIIFFVKSHEARRLWHRFLFSKLHLHDQSVELRSPSEIAENFVFTPSVFAMNCNALLEGRDSSSFTNDQL